MASGSLQGLAAGSPTGAGFDLLLLLHGVLAVVGLGAVVVTGIQAIRLRSVGPEEEPPESLRRYFVPGFNWAARSLYGIPLLGFALLAASNGAYDLQDGWVLGGLVISLVVIALGEWRLWPLERRIQEMLSGTEEQASVRVDINQACTATSVLSALMSVLLIAASVLMFVRP